MGFLLCKTKFQSEFYFFISDTEIKFEIRGKFTRMGIRLGTTFIVSFAYLTAVEGNVVRVRNDDRPIPIGNTYKQEFFKLVNSKLLSFPTK